MFIVADIDNKKKGNKPSKKKNKDEMPQDMSMPSGDTSKKDEEEEDGDDVNQTDDGPTENLMEKGKKISL